jgi:hypothetical protein
LFEIFAALARRSTSSNGCFQREAKEARHFQCMQAALLFFGIFLLRSTLFVCGVCVVVVKFALIPTRTRSSVHHQKEKKESAPLAVIGSMLRGPRVVVVRSIFFATCQLLGVRNGTSHVLLPNDNCRFVFGLFARWTFQQRNKTQQCTKEQNHPPYC